MNLQRAGAILVLLVACGVSALFLGDGPPVSETPDIPDTDPKSMRLISLAPSVTEILYELDLAPRIAGVTSYCDYPPEAKQKPSVGGFMDLSFESILRLEPTHVILLTFHEDVGQKLKSLGIQTLTVSTDRIPGILAATETIGAACGRTHRARELTESWRALLKSTRKRYAAARRVRVMVVLGHRGRNVSEGTTLTAGSNTFYQDLLDILGVTNVCADLTGDYPELGREGLLRLAPEIILEVHTDSLPPAEIEKAQAFWKQLPEIPAVQQNAIYLIDDDYATVPGPRFPLLLATMERQIRKGGSDE